MQGDLTSLCSLHGNEEPVGAWSSSLCHPCFPPPLLVHGSADEWEEGELRAVLHCLGDRQPRSCPTPDGQSRVINWGCALIKASPTCPDPDGHKQPQNEEVLSISLNDPQSRDRPRPWQDISGYAWENKKHWCLFLATILMEKRLRAATQGLWELLHHGPEPPKI